LSKNTPNLVATSLDKTTGSNWSVREELDRRQFGPAEKYLLVEQLPVGFGAQMSGRVLALKLSLALQRKAIFRHDSDPPYLQTLEPQYSHIPLDIDWDSADLLDPLVEQAAVFLRYDYWIASKRLELIADRVETWAQRKIAQRFVNVGITNIDGEILKWMRLLPSVQSAIDETQRSLGVSSKTLGVHLRRGDKSVETAYVPTKHFNHAISLIHQTWRFESIFLASDSPDAAAEIQLPPGVKLIFDRDEKRYNNANHKMLFRNPDLARQETFTAAKNLALLSACGGIVGQDNAHFAIIASAIIVSNGCSSSRINLVSGQLAEFEFPLLGLYFRLKRAVRAFVRTHLPRRLLKKLSRNVQIVLPSGSGSGQP
jgi:hypothetical protein